MLFSFLNIGMMTSSTQAQKWSASQIKIVRKPNSSSFLTKNIGINIATGDIVQQVSAVLVLLANFRNSLFFSLDKKYPLVTEVTRPVCVDLGQKLREKTWTDLVNLLVAVRQCSETTPEPAALLSIKQQYYHFIKWKKTAASSPLSTKFKRWFLCSSEITEKKIFDCQTLMEPKGSDFSNWYKVMRKRNSCLWQVCAQIKIFS